MPRPRGTFFLTSELGQVGTGAAGHRDSIKVTLSDSGTAEVVYRTSGVSGQDWVLVRRDSSGAKPDDSAAVVIRLTGLEHVPASSANFVLDSSTNHTGYDEYLQPGAIELLDSLWAAWKELHRVHPTAYPMTGSRFSVDATSIVDGGLLDIAGDWNSRKIGHLAHREGVDVDFNNTGAESAPDKVAALCMSFFWHFSPVDSVRLSCLFHGGTGLHFHVFLVPLQGRDNVLSWRLR